MTCDREQLSYYVDGELDPDEVRQLQQHLAECERCRVDLATYRQLDDEVSRLESRRAPSELRRRIYHQVEERRRARARWGWAAPLVPAVPLTVGFVLVAGGVIVWRSLPPGSAPIMTAAFAVQETPDSLEGLRVELVFDRPVAADSLGQAITFDPPLAVSQRVQENKVELIPEAPIQAGSSYRVTVSNVRDRQGNAQSEAVVLNLTTGSAPQVVQESSPAEPARGAPPASAPPAGRSTQLAPLAGARGQGPGAGAAPDPRPSAPDPWAPTPDTRPTPAPSAAAQVAATTIPTPALPTATLGSAAPPTPTGLATGVMVAAEAGGAGGGSAAALTPRALASVPSTDGSAPFTPPSPGPQVSGVGCQVSGEPAPTTRPSTPDTWNPTPGCSTPTPRATAEAAVPATTPLPPTPTDTALAALVATPSSTPAASSTASPAAAVTADLLTANPDLQRRLGAPVAPERAIRLSEQSFQGGLMLHRTDTDVIYSLIRSTARWTSYPDTWRPGEVLPPVGPRPPGTFEPLRGFGKIWREQPSVKLQLGWPVYEEQIATGSLQPFEQGTLLRPGSAVAYALLDDGTWRGVPDPRR